MKKLRKVFLVSFSALFMISAMSASVSAQTADMIDIVDEASALSIFPTNASQPLIPLQDTVEIIEIEDEESAKALFEDTLSNQPIVPIAENDTIYSIEDEETPLEANAITGVTSIIPISIVVMAVAGIAAGIAVLLKKKKQEK